MLSSIKQLYGDKLCAADGEIGHVKDFYFDDQNWVVRYVIVDTGSWLPGRLVLLSPHAFTEFYQDGHCRTANLTRQQIENSPSVESHKPVSRHFEEEYYRYYDWPAYWDGTGMWGIAGYPTLMAPYLEPSQLANHASKPLQADDPHLRSTRAVQGYKIQTHDGKIGQVVDFIVHEKSWAITHVLVETGHWYAGKQIAVAPKHIERISYEDAKVFVKVTKEAIQGAPEYQVPPWAYEDAPSIAR
jgi:uncharacterized protein YrrD